MAARLDLPPLAPFDLQGEPWTTGPRWTKWLQRFDAYVAAQGLTTADNDAQIRNLLLYQAGEQVMDVFDGLSKDAQGTTSKAARDALNKEFEVAHNATYERFLFHQVKQEPGEPVSRFHQRLVAAARHCRFADLTETLICDRLILGCTSDAVRRRLLRDSDGSLKKALEICRTAESAEHHASRMEKQSSVSSPLRTVHQVQHPSPARSDTRLDATRYRSSPLPRSATSTRNGTPARTASV